MVVPGVRVRAAVMVVMVVRWVRDQALMRKEVGWEAEHVERTGPVIHRLVVVVMMVMVRMHMVMVVCRLRALVPALRFWRVSAVTVDSLLIVS